MISACQYTVSGIFYMILMTILVESVANLDENAMCLRDRILLEICLSECLCGSIRISAVAIESLPLFIKDVNQ